MDIKFGGGEPTAVGKYQAQKNEILNSLSTQLMKAGLPGAFSLTLPETVGGGTLNFRAIIGRDSGRIMYNMSVKGATIGKEHVTLSGSGNLMLPANGWTVDPVTLKAYKSAGDGIEFERKKARGVQVTPDSALEEGETTV